MGEVFTIFGENTIAVSEVCLNPGGALGKSVREFRKSVQDDDPAAKRPPVQGEGEPSQKA